MGASSWAKVIAHCVHDHYYLQSVETFLSRKNGTSTFMRCGNLTYDPWIWLKMTSLSSTASVLNDGRISLEIPSFCPDFFFLNKVILAISLLISKTLSGFENLSGPNDLNRHDNITGLYDLSSLFGLKKNQKLLAL